MLSEHISGEAHLAGAILSAMVLVRLPPVETFTTASVACLITGRKHLKCSGSMETFGAYIHNLT